MSRDRKSLLDVLAQLSEACPEMRFGQLIANLATLSRGLAPEAIWDCEDQELLLAAQQQLDYFLQPELLEAAEST